MNKILKVLSLVIISCYCSCVYAECLIPLNLNKNNSKGLENKVKQIQLVLSQDYELYHPGYISGYFGKLTEKGIKNLQKRYGIKETGNIDEKTKEILCSILNKNRCPILNHGYTVGSSDNINKNNDIILIQQLLSNNAEYHTGYFGNITKKLLEDFQKQFNLKQTGVFDKETKFFMCSMLTKQDMPTQNTTNIETTKEVRDFTNANLIQYLKSEITGKTLNILLNVENLLKNEEIYINFNKTEIKEIILNNDYIEIILNLEEDNIYNIKQIEKVSWFNKIKQELFASTFFNFIYNNPKVKEKVVPDININGDTISQEAKPNSFPNPFESNYLNNNTIDQYKVIDTNNAIQNNFNYSLQDNLGAKEKAQETTVSTKIIEIKKFHFNWKCNKLTKQCYFDNNGTYLSKTECDKYCSQDYSDKSNLYSFGTKEYNHKKINLQILNQDGKVFEKDFYILRD